MNDLIALRRDIHRHPETAFEEHRTARLVVDELNALGIDVTSGLAGTGVVGTLKCGDGPAIGLRADLDALHLQEANQFSHRSVHDGKMHACGHDGHVAMLLGAARRLAATQNFAGTVNFIFQPAEENECGGRVMIEEGLFNQFPVDWVFGMHNWPGLAAGEFASRPGAIMAAFDTFEIEVQGHSAHAAMPHQGDDTVLAASQLVLSLQSIASRCTDPLDSVVVSVTQIHGGNTWNVLPASTVIRGGVRHFHKDECIKEKMSSIVAGISEASGTAMTLRYEARYPATINTAGETAEALAAAVDLVGADNVHDHLPPSMGSEDFGYMLLERPGCYVWIGNGRHDSAPLHNDRYDFNDSILETGARYWERLVERLLPNSSSPQTSESGCS